jgi:hypothetical protein
MTTDNEELLTLALKESMRMNGDKKTNREDTMRDNNRVRFDKTINLGHIISALLMLASVMFSWSVMDKRVVVLEEARAAQRERDTAQDLVSRDKFQEVKDALQDLRRAVEKVSDKVGAK